MDTITVKKSEFLNAVKDNRDHHRQVFEKAIEAYRSRAVELLEEHIERVKSGSLERVAVVLPLPQDHTDDYDRVIAMMEMDVRDEIELHESEFSRYVLDEWGWKQEFTTTNASYGVHQ